jgi:glutathione synthase/RimK-type ligase-like ATP-grasp enzyme
MILVCGGLADKVTEFELARLNDCGYPYRLLDLGTFPEGYRVNWEWDGLYPRGYIATDEWRLELDEISGVYSRFIGPEGRQVSSDVKAEFAPAFYGECDAALSYLFEHMPSSCAVVNRLAGGMTNHSKLYQALLVRECGLLTPPTLVTNDPEEAHRFFDENDGQVIYKSLSGIRSIVRRMGAEQLARLPLLSNGPTQFQAFIDGDNVRVHTVGDNVFATRIRSGAVDYRYARQDGESVEMEPAELPVGIAEACARLANRLGLLFTGIDLKETPQGDYYCFEVNPCPAFTFYEANSGQPISTALADLLYHGMQPGATRVKNAYVPGDPPALKLPFQVPGALNNAHYQAQR